MIDANHDDTKKILNSLQEVFSSVMTSVLTSLQTLAELVSELDAKRKMYRFIDVSRPDASLDISGNCRSNLYVNKCPQIFPHTPPRFLK